MYYISIDPQEFHGIPHGLSMDSPLKGRPRPGFSMRFLGSSAHGGYQGSWGGFKDGKLSNHQTYGTYGGVHKYIINFLGTLKWMVFFSILKKWKTHLWTYG